MGDFGKALAGFGAGFFGGYKDMLKSKAEEEVQMRRDEAMYERQKNLEDLRAAREKPYKDADLELKGTQLGMQADHWKDQIRLQEEQFRQQTADRAAARGEAAAGRSERLSLERERLSLAEKQAKGEFDEVREANADKRLAAQSLKIEDESERNAFLASGMSLKEWSANKFSTERSTQKELINDAVNMSKDQIAEVNNMKPEDLFVFAAERGIKVDKKDVPVARAMVNQAIINENKVAIAGKPIVQDKQLNPDMLARGVIDGDKKAVEIYSSLSKAEQYGVDRRRALMESEDKRRTRERDKMADDAQRRIDSSSYPF